MITNSTISLDNKLTNNNQKTSVKLLVFAIDKLTLSLPILQVKKVIKYNPIQGSGLSHVGLTHLSEEDLTVVDLHRKLFQHSLPQESQTQGYFIITKAVDREPLGIFVAQPPSLIDVPTTKIRLIPESYRRADTLAIASHVTVVSQADGSSKTIFILDVASLI